MATFDGQTLGALLTLLGYDGAAFRNLKTDADGHLQIDGLSLALPAGAATEATLATLATEAKLEAVRALVASLDGKDFATQVTLAALLTELQLKADLTETQPVSAAALPLPAGAATEATLATLATDAKLELVRLLLVSLAAEDFATQTTLALLLTELALKADLTETQPVSAAALPLPSGAATAANQALMVTALQLIDNLVGALHSVGTDRLIVRQENQGFSFADKLFDPKANADSDVGDIDLFSSTVPSGEVWVVTSVTAINTVTVCSMIYLYHYDDATWCGFRRQATPTILEGVEWAGHLYLTPGDKILAQFGACVLHDVLALDVLGYKMTLEEGSGPGPYAPSYQDFTDWTEVDSDGDITVAANLITVDSMRRDAVSYVYLDLGADYFGDFIHYLTVRVTDAQAYSAMACWGLSNGAHTIQDKVDADVGITVEWYFTAGADLTWSVKDYDGDTVDSYVDSYNATRHLTIQRSGTTLTCKIYSDAARTTLLDTLSVVCATTKYRYVELIQSRDSNGNPAASMDGWVSDFGW